MQIINFGVVIEHMQFIRSYQPTFAERYPVPLLMALLDLSLIVLAGLLGYWYRYGSLDMTGRFSTATLVTGVVVVLCLSFGGVYGSQRGYSFARQLSVLLLCWLVATGILFSITFFFKISENYSRIWFAATLIIGGAFCFLLRLFIFVLLRHLRSSGFNLKSVLLVDSGGQSAGQLNSGKVLVDYGFKLESSLTYQSNDGWLKRLVEEVDERGVHEVWLCLPLSEAGAVSSILYALRHYTVAVRFIPEWGDIPLLNHKVSRIAGIYSLDLSCSPIDGPARIIKRLEDLVIGGLISLMILPLCIVIGVAIKLTSPGPMLFKQLRMGINGKEFKVYKFRSMVVHQETCGGVTQATRRDSRVTRIGAFLRRTSLDELPQFFNVLQGRMSIVGPRPHALAHNEYYKDLVESYMQRHKVKPGITGWAQVSGYRGETDTLDKMQKRVEFDLWYIDNWSFFLDIKIICLTALKGFVGKNAF